MPATVTAFLGDNVVAAGPPEAVTRELEQRYPGDLAAIRVFDDDTGKPSDLDYWDAMARAPSPLRGRGRPKLGVTAREVTLLPRQWEWLGTQPGGASGTIRRLVDEARKGPTDAKAKRDSAYRFMTEMGGDRPGYEDAIRALYRGELDSVRKFLAGWPADLRDYAERLLA
jgi:hypothetical protein